MMLTPVPIPKASVTTAISQSIVDQLEASVGGELAVAFYPEKPASYRLNHPHGALLMSYAKSSYPKHDDTMAVARPRTLTVTITIVSRGLYSRYGAVPLVDWVLAMLSGYTPMHCDKPLAPMKDEFVMHEAGLWFYAVDFVTEAVLVQTLGVPAI